MLERFSRYQSCCCCEEGVAMTENKRNGESNFMKPIKTRIFSNPSQDEIEEIGAMLRAGKLVALPTETVYGLGANGLDSEAMGHIYEAKGRPSDNPLILHVDSKDSVAPLVADIPPLAQKLMDAFWPGPLTITLEKSKRVPHRATGGLSRVALRCPNHDLTRKIIRAAGLPIAAPSANLSGRPSPTTAEAVLKDMEGRIDAIVDAGPCPIGVESTVVEVQKDALVILRPGGITEEMLKTITPQVSYDKHLLGAKEAPKAPGMKYKHYAPDAEMLTFVGHIPDVAMAMVAQMDKLVENKKKGRTMRIGLLLSSEVLDEINAILQSDQEDDFDGGESEMEIIPILYESNEDLAHSLYQTLLDFNQAKVDYILAQGIPEEGLGVAIMNRMKKASAGHVVNV